MDLHLIQLHARTHLVSPGVKVHHEVLGLGVPVPDLALVAVRVPRHLLRLVAVLAMLRQKVVVRRGQGLAGLGVERRP